MKASQLVSWGLILALVPVLTLASSQSGDSSTDNMPSQSDNMSSQSMETTGQNMEGMPRQGGASGMQNQSGSMQNDRQQQMQQSHETSSPAIGTHGQHQQDGAGSMNESNTTKTGQGTAEIPDQRTQDDTAP